MAQLLLRGEPLADVDAVLFDKDGTLSISEPSLLALANARVFHCDQLLRQQQADLHGRLGSELRDLLTRAYGLRGDGLDPAGTTAVASRAHNLISTATALAQLGLGWPEALELAEATFLATDHLQGEGSAHRAEATEGLHALVERLANATVRCAVISNDDVSGIETFLASQGIRRHFQAIWSAEHSPRKPDPAAVLALCRELGVEPGRCLLIGDANSDLLMARRAGLAQALGYLAGWRSEPPLDASFPRMRHWEDLEVQLP
ncbi:haloacid dehalogenase/epoxide hydrolase family [Cyanobium sp. PCC 7001]|uniref:HAD family hydrolase n=1 Tax=Cyanobium sp. PCC 7001 TaxID=180281 RepID=UPI0001805432|nr:HAD-IA family hydrolase [Cyanobium sp. PCC 7001]EDY39075.1 haloacid dehalogenase/epoxide hydrolase family [Cyanobium sp. PCC 7001]